MSKHFGFEELDVWHRALEFCNSAIDMSENLKTNRNHFRLIEQFEAASASVPMNIAEGKGRRSKKEFIRFLYLARGSLYETVTLANIFAKRSWITEQELDKLENEAKEIVSMIKGLINYLSK